MARTTVIDRIDEMLAAYEALDSEANELIDRYITDVVCPRHSIPSGVLRAIEITNRAGLTLNIPEALRIMRRPKD